MEREISKVRITLDDDIILSMKFSIINSVFALHYFKYLENVRNSHKPFFI